MFPAFRAVAFLLTRSHHLLTAKALYREALAHVVLKEDDEAEEALVKAHALVKEDQAIIGELEKVRGRLRGKRDKEKAQFKKMFA